MVKKFKDILLGAATATITYTGINTAFPPHEREYLPYDQVDISSIKKRRGVFFIKGTFYKRECTMSLLEVFGVENDNTPVPLSWEPFGKDQSSFNKTKGPHLFEIKVISNPEEEYNYLDIRTRHDCGGGNYVDKTFALIPL